MNTYTFFACVNRSIDLGRGNLKALLLCFERESEYYRHAAENAPKRIKHIRAVYENYTDKEQAS